MAGSAQFSAKSSPFVISETRTAVSIELNGFKRNNIFVGDTFSDPGATVTYDDASTSVITTSDTIDNTQKSTNTLTYSIDALSTTRIVKVLTRLDTPSSADFDINGIRSWHMSDLDGVYNGVLLSGFTDVNGAQGVVEFDAATRQIINSRLLQDALFPQDGHNSVPHLMTSAGRLITLFTGHGIDRDNNTDATYFCSESATGRIEQLSDPIRFTLGLTSSNYCQMFESQSGVIVALTNDDTSNNWIPVFRTGENAWSAEAGLITLGSDGSGGQQQYYTKGVMIGDRLRVFGIPHPTNAQNAIRVIEYDVVTKEVFTSTGASVGTTSGGNAQSAAVVAAQNAALVAQPASGRSQRLLDASDDGLGLLIARYDTSNGANGEYGYLYCTNPANPFSSANWSYITIIGYQDDSYLDISRRYVGGSTFAREVSTYIGVNISRKVGTSWVLERHIATAQGEAFTGEVIYTATGTQEVSRPNSPKNATATANIVFAVGSYGDYLNFNTQLQVVDWETPAETVNTKPSVTINAPSTLTVNGTAQLSATITDDPEDTHTLQWGVSAGSFDDATSATPTVTAPATAQTITYTLTVTDNNGLASDEATATTTVTELQAFSPTKSRPIKVDRRLKVSKTDGFELDINKWLEGEAIASFQVLTPDGKTSVVSTSETGGIMRVLLTGIEKGAAEVHFEYATATGRDDCTVMLVIVVDDC